MRGENSQVLASARIVDHQGNVQSYVTTTWTSKLIVGFFGVSISAILILMLMVVYTKVEVDSIKRDIEVMEGQNSNVNSTQSNRK